MATRRQRRQARRQARFESRQARKAARTDVIQARADKKRAKGEAKKMRAKSRGDRRAFRQSSQGNSLGKMIKRAVFGIIMIALLVGGFIFAQQTGLLSMVMGGIKSLFNSAKKAVGMKVDERRAAGKGLGSGNNLRIGGEGAGL